MIGIIGTGPAGSYVASLLAKGGMKVKNYEEDEKIGRPIQCTGIVTKDIKKYVKFRPHHQNIWNLRQRYIDDFGPKKVSFSKTLLDDFSRSKVIVCTYPETSFFEAMYSGIPTILLYKKEYWEIHSEFDELIEKLIESKILFDNPLFASNHINKIWLIKL